MRKILLFTLLIPMFGISQITYQDLKFIVDNKPKKSIDYIKTKGYSLDHSKTEEDITNIGFVKYKKDNKTIDSFIDIYFTENTRINLRYITFNIEESTIITNDIEKYNYKLIESTYNDNICNKFSSNNYIFENCENLYPKNTLIKKSYFLYLENIIKNNE